MARPVIVFSGPLADLPFSQVVAKAAEWSCDGIELCTWGDHLEVQRAAGEPAYVAGRLQTLAEHDFQAVVVSAHRVGQAVCDPISERHRGILPDYVWGDGNPEDVRTRATEELIATVRIAQQLGCSVVSGFLGSPLWASVAGWPRPSPDEIDAGLDEFARRAAPVLDACRDAGIRFALEVHPGQIAFDLYSAERTLAAVGEREEFAFTFDPSHLHWQGVDPVQFIRAFPDRIAHVHVKDAALRLDGRAGVLNSYFGKGDTRCGWEFRAPGRGGVDWENVVRALNEIGYDGPLAIDWGDAGVDRDFGIGEACQFIRQLDFPRAPTDHHRSAFGNA